jgi:TPR repeat protein
MMEGFEFENIKTDLTEKEEIDLNTQIEHTIDKHRNNRQEINRLVFECIEAMTEGDSAQTELSNKGFLARLVGGLTGSNAMLQNKINSNRSVAQYASQQILSKLAEQNLMSFELITAVNNKLNASIFEFNVEINNIYEIIYKSCLQIKNDIENLDERVSKLENKVSNSDRWINLSKWVKSIKDLKFNGRSYPCLNDAQKIVCLARDFYDITKGEWETSDLLLLKDAMSGIGMNPGEKVNFLSVIEEVSEQEILMKKFLGYHELKEKVDPSYLVFTGAIQKFQLLQGEEHYIVDSLEENLGENISEIKIMESLTQNFMKKNAGVDLNTEIENCDLILDLLYNIEEFSGLLTNITSELAITIQTFLSGNKLEAFNSFVKMANSGNGRACYWVSLYYTYGYDVSQLDYSKAEEYVKKGCELGDPVATFSAMLSNNNSQEEITSHAKLLLNSSEANEADTQTLLGDMYRNLREYEEAVKWYRKAADQGYAKAQSSLGVRYRDGNGVEKNYEEAMKWCRKAAVQGHAPAQNNLGTMYYTGNGVEKNYKEAVKWYRKAADQGHASAQNYLGVMHFYGKGVEKNYKEAVKWFRKAADQGHEDAQQNLGVMYYTGNGVEKNYKEAVKWYRKAADQGNAEAQNNLAEMYDKGKGVKKNKEKAAQLYQEAADQGNKSAREKVRLAQFKNDAATVGVCVAKYGIPLISMLASKKGRK